MNANVFYKSTNKDVSTTAFDGFKTEAKTIATAFNDISPNNQANLSESAACAYDGIHFFFNINKAQLLILCLFF